MSVRSANLQAVFETLLKRDSVPAKELQWIQVVDDRQRIQFVQTRDDIAVLDLGQPADVQHKLRPSMPPGKLVARRRNVAVCQPQSLADLAQTQSGKQGILARWEPFWNIYSM